MNTFGIHFMGNVNDNSVEVLRNQLLTANTASFDEIIIYMSSTGGSLHAGFTAYEYVKSSHIPVTIVNMGTIESIAVIMYLAGEKRLATPNSKFLLHCFNWTFSSPTVNYIQLREAIRSLDFDQNRYSNIFNERTAGAQNPIDVSKCLKGDSAMFDADLALAAGIIHDIIPTTTALTLATQNDWPRVNTF